MTENQSTSTMDTLLRGMDQFANTKAMVGGPVQVGDTIVIPLVDVACGMVAGSFAGGVKQEQRDGGGMSAKMSPSAVLVVQGGVTKLVNIKSQDVITKVIGMALDFINKFLEERPTVSKKTA